MRKESIGRLLLTLLTAFIMVAGVLGAAISNTSFESESPSGLDVAARELDNKMSGAGDTPASAMQTSINHASATGNAVSDKPSLPNEHVLDLGSENTAEKTDSQATSVPEATGTRAPTLDANGPYGTQANPLYEGSTVDFHATLSNPDPGMTYSYRWDAQDDGEFETGWQSTADYTHYFDDNNIGQARVQAWDGTWTTTTYYGDGWDEWLDCNVGFYCYPTYDAVFGWQFVANFDVTVYELGAAKVEYWNYPYPNTPDYYEYTALYTSGGTLLAMTGELHPADDSWAWEAISPVTLTAGNSYVVVYKAIAASTTYPDYYSPGDYATSMSLDDDNALTYVGYRYYYYGGFPVYGPYSSYAPLVDMHYYYEEVVPNVVEDTADVWVDNVAPIPLGASATPDVGTEGAAVTFTGSLYDASTADSWEYMWDFGDGQMTDWMPVRKIGGTARILLLHSWVWDAYGQAVYDSIEENLGGFIEVMDRWDFGPVVNEGVPELSDLLNYDVVLISMDYYIYDTGITNGLGDVLADFSDLGGGVVQCTFASGNGYYSQVAGRWMSQGYNPLQYAANHYGYVDMGTVYDSTHMIMTGVNEMSAYYKHGTYGVTAGATLLADYVGGYKLCAYTNENHHVPGGGRVVGLNTFVWPDYVQGDGMKMIANSIMWASGKAYYLSMPIPLDPVEHVYKDDHPEHITPSDGIIAKLIIRDDDHGKVVPLGGLQEIMPLQKFDGGFPPAGWTVINNNPPNEPWRPNTYYGRTNYAGGDGACADADSDYAIYYGGYDIDSELWTPSIDLSTFPSASLTFITSYNWLGGSESAEVDVSTDGGSTWTNILSWASDHSAYGPGETVSLDLSPFAGGNAIIRFHYDAAGGWMWWWEVDDIVVEGFESYIMDGMGESPDLPVTIQNAMPMAHSPAGFEFVVDESSVIAFEGFTLSDPALKVETEEFWWRWDFEDGSPLTDWHVTNEIIPGAVGGNLFVTGVPMDFPVAYGYSIDGANQLLYNMMRFSVGDEGTVLYMDSSWFGSSAIMSSMETNLNNIFGTSYDWTYTTGSEDLVDAGGNPRFDILYFGYDWAYTGAPPYDLDEITEYLDAGGHVIVTGDEFNYGVLDFLPYFVEYTGFTPWTTFPGPAFTGPVVDEIAQDVATGSWGFSYCLHNEIADFDDAEYLPVFADPDPITTLVRPGEARHPKNLVLPIEHVFGDNGVYYVDLQLIDDDMMWDLSGGSPVFVGPAGEEMNWISHNIFPIEIDNTDPVISPGIRAYADVDLSLRMSGNKQNTAVMTLVENGVVVAETAVLRDPGTPDIGVLSARIQMTKGYDYELYIDYIPEDGDGANPTWIFEGHFPDGKIKELRHTFNSNDPSDTHWDLGSVKALMLGHDIIFEADASDSGSDDLAFIWNFGDTTPHGVHIYANADSSSATEGVSDEATLIFNQDAQRDPWFDKAPNTLRSPQLNPIAVTDTITHVFDENQAYYYYVHLTVIDDDVDEDYPTNSVNPGSDSEYCEIDFR